MPRTVTVPVRIDAGQFRAFADFEFFRHRKRWVRPALAGALLLAAAVACFVLSMSRSPALLWAGWVLALAAVGLPAVWIGRFYRSVTKEAARMGLQTPQAAYHVTLGPEGVGIALPGQLDKAPRMLDWAGVWGAYRTPDAVYLYENFDRAYILPADQAQGGGDALWAVCAAALPAEKLHDVR